ncbi:MAG: nucleotidyltransferase substrate binding protein, partial [Candidatus Hydrogenedentota bacterium]
PMPEPRWRQRFRQYEKALHLLAEALEGGADRLSGLEKEGVIQRFEYTFELAWKTLNDYLTHAGLTPDTVTPRGVIKEAFAAGILPEGQQWIDMIEHRNLMMHTYNHEILLEAIDAIQRRYLPQLEQLRQWLNERNGT